MGMDKLTVKDINLRGKKIDVRADFNVPLDKNLKITDDRRIKESLPTIQYLLKNGSQKIILMSHLGRPDAKVVEGLRLRPAGQRLGELLGEKVLCLDDCIGEGVKQKVAASQERVILLEN